jgi:hypothetical protein
MIHAGGNIRFFATFLSFILPNLVETELIVVLVILQEYTDRGTLIKAHVPLALSKQLMPLRHQPTL